jgi:hypothetical protein
MDLQTKLFLTFLVLAILKDIIVYSVGRSHNASELEFHVPTIKEWLIIILLICVLYWLGGHVARWVVN